MSKMAEILGNVWCCVHQNSWPVMYGHIRNLVQWFTETHGSFGSVGHRTHGSLGILGQWFTGTHGSFGSLGQ